MHAYSNTNMLKTCCYGSFYLAAEEASVILKALAQIAHETCIRFTPCCYHNETDYVHIKTGPGCHAGLGRRGGEQIIVLGSSQRSKSCARPGTVERHLMKTLGFYPEHLRPDRDEFVRINLENIKPQKLAAFEKYQTALFDPHKIQYDYHSVTHGDYKDFSKNELKTIAPKYYEVTIGHRYGLSDGDIAKINSVYCSSSARILSNISIWFVLVMTFLN